MLLIGQVRQGQRIEYGFRNVEATGDLDKKNFRSLVEVKSLMKWFDIKKGEISSNE